MSIRVMSLAWDLPLSSTEKLVLLALADCANDEGECWPSIATIGRKACIGERSVQRSIQSLKDAGHLSRMEIAGKGCRYIIHPRHSDTPATVAPVTDVTAPPPQCHPTPATVAPKPSMNHQEPSSDTSYPQSARAPKRGSTSANAFPKPEWADPQVWDDFLLNRKRKGTPNTATAYKRFLTDIDRWTTDEWPPPKILEHAAAKGWAGIYEPKDDQHERPQPHRSFAGQSGVIDIAQQVLADRRARRAGAGAR